MNNSGIYKITNTKNGKFYIGSSKHLDRRWWEHKNDLLKNKHINTKLQHSWNYHGENAFEFTILETIEEEKIIEREQFYLDVFKPYTQGIGYNIGKNACGGDTFTNNPNKIIILENITKANNTGHMHGRTHKPESIELQKQKAIGRYSLEWFRSRYGDIEGTIKHKDRVDKLKSRKINYTHDNGLTGIKTGPPSQEIRDRISNNKAKFKLRKNAFYIDLGEGTLTIQQLADKYEISTAAVKYHKRKL